MSFRLIALNYLKGNLALKTTREQKRKYLEIIAGQKANIHTYGDEIEKAFGATLNYDVGIFKDMSRSLQNYVELVAEHTGIHIDALAWFVYENDCGKNKMSSAWLGQEMRVIDSIDAFLDFQYEQNNVQR